MMAEPSRRWCCQVVADNGAMCQRWRLSFVRRAVCWAHASTEEQAHNARACRAAEEERRAARQRERAA